MMNKPELEALLEELDEALVKAFPGPEPMSVLVVGGACLLFQGVTTRPTVDVDVIIFEMMGSEESTLIFHAPVADKVRRIIKGIGKRHGLKGQQQLFLNDDCAPFLLELSGNELPPMRLFKAYQKLHLYVPSELSYILACKLMAGRATKDFADIEVLCQRLGIRKPRRPNPWWIGTSPLQLIKPSTCCLKRWKRSSGNDGPFGSHRHGWSGSPLCGMLDSRKATARLFVRMH